MKDKYQSIEICGSVKNLQIIATFILLLPIFFNRISFGASVEYSEENSFSLPFHNFEPFLILFLALVYHINFRVNKIQLNLIFLFALPVLIIQVFYFIFYHVSPIAGNSINYLSRFIRAYIYIFAVLVYSIILFNPLIFTNILIKFLHAISWICVISYLFHLILGSDILLHYQIDSDYYRIQGFFSEPSATAAPFGALLLISVYDKKKIYIILSIICVILSKSPTTILTLLLSVLVVLITNKKFKVITFLTLLSLAVFIYVYITLIDTNEVFQALSNADSSIFSSIGRLVSGLDNVKNGGITGSNARFQGSQELLDDMERYGLFCTGYGFNSSSEFYHSKYGDTRDYALQFSILFSYGIFGMIMFYVMLFTSYTKMYLMNYKVFLLFTPFIVCSFINSAQGFVMYQITFLCMFSFLFRKILK